MDFGVNASQPVSFVCHDVVLENPVANGSPLLYLQRMEALRGPQGALFGRNTTAGIVKFVSNPPTVMRESSIRLSAGDRDIGEGKSRSADHLGFRSRQIRPPLRWYE